MVTRLLYILSSLLLCSLHLAGQEEYAVIKVDTLFGSQPLPFKFTINDVELELGGKSYEVPISLYAFDTIRIQIKQNPAELAIMRLKADTEYLLNYNTCSFYTLQPALNPHQGMVRFSIESADTTSYYVDVGWIDPKEMSSRKADNFHFYPPSALCQYAARSISISTTDFEVLKELRFHFLHGELLNITYDTETNTIIPELYAGTKSINDRR